jgi:hypothetical protein
MVLVVCCVGLWFLFGQVFRARFAVVPGDLGDSRFNAIILEHGFRYLRADAWHRPFWSPHWAFFPHQNVLAYSDNLLGTLPLYALLRTFRLNEFSAFNVWILVLSVANFVAMYFLVRSLKLSRMGAALAGFLFAFAMPRGQQLNHLQLLPQFFTPLCFLCIVNLRSLRAWAVWGVFGCAILQLYAAVYLGWFLALALGIVVLVGLVMCLFSRNVRGMLLCGARRLWLHVLASLLVSAVALIPLVMHYGPAQSEVGPRNYEEIGNMLPRLSSYLLPANYTFLYHAMQVKLQRGVPIAHEQVMFAGYLALVCMLVLLLSLCRRSFDCRADWWKYIFAAIWLTSFVTTLWIGGSLWSFIYRILPGGGAIRAVSRIVLLQLLPLGVAAAWAATWLEARAGRAVAALLVLLVVFENSGLARYNFAVREHDARVSRIRSELAGKTCSSFFVSGTDEPYKIQLDAMWASLQSRIPTINGYSGNEPPRWRFRELKDVTKTELRMWLRRYHANRKNLCVLRH